METRLGLADCLAVVFFFLEVVPFLVGTFLLVLVFLAFRLTPLEVTLAAFFGAAAFLVA